MTQEERRGRWGEGCENEVVWEWGWGRRGGWSDLTTRIFDLFVGQASSSMALLNQVLVAAEDEEGC